MYSNHQRKLDQKRAYKQMYKSKEAPRSTTGKSKGIVATPTQKGMCRRNRSWKDKNYDAIMKSLGRRSTGK